jgi:hypothetical protein
VPTGSVIPPSPPGSAADVEAIKAGMIGAGADPTTLAPGSGSAPAPMPGAVVTAQAGEASRTPDPRYPDIVAGGVTQQHPGTMADFRAKEYVQPPKTEDFNPNLTPAQQGEFAALSRGIEKRNAILQAGGVPLAQQSQEAREIAVAREDLQAKIQAAAQAKAAAAATNQTKWDDKQDTQMQQRYDKRLEVYNAAAAEQQKQADARATAEQLAKTTAAQSDLTSRLASRQKNLDALDAEAKGSTDALHNLELTDTLSKAAGAASLLPANVRDWLVNTGAATPDQIQKWSAGAALEAANNRLIQSLKGTGFSRITNQDLTFLTNSSSGGLGTPEQFRDAKTAFLMTLLKRNNQFAAQVHNFVDTGMNLPQAHEAADEKLGPIIPRVPGAAEIAKFSQSPNARALWMFDNLEPGTFYKDERGRLRINTRSPADLRPPE